MTHREIRAQLILLGVTACDIAREVGVSHQAVCQTMSGRTVSARIRRAIARKLGMPVKKIWPPARKAA